MIKRSRSATRIHFCIANYQRVLETNFESLNKQILSDIKKYYKDNRNSILFDIDENGEFKLSDTGIFVNKVEILYNVLENNHKHSFELLLKHQFKKDIKTINDNKKYPIAEINKKIKQSETEKVKQALNEIKEIQWEEGLIEEYQNRKHIHNDKDKMYKLLSEISKYIKTNDKETLLRIAEEEVKHNFNYLNTLKRLKTFITNSVQQLQNKISYLVNDPINNKQYIQLLDYMIILKIKGIEFTNKFSPKDIEEIDNKMLDNKSKRSSKFKKFLRSIGYRNKSGSYILSPQILEDVKMLKS